MAGLTLVQAEAQLALYIAAEQAVLLGQEFEIKDRKLKRADLGNIRDGIEYWDNKVKELTARGSRTGPTMKGVTPV